MGSIDVALTQKSYNSDELLEKIGEKLPKKLRKKLRWKKIAPILRLLIALILNFVNAPARQRPAEGGAAAEKRPTGSALNRQPDTAKKFANERLRAQVERALAYQAEIDRLAQNATEAASQNRLRELAAHVQQWAVSIANLAQQVENFGQNKLIGADVKEVPKSIGALESRLAGESDPVVRAELERTLANRRQQLTALEKLQRNTQLAEIKIENTLSMLGTVYSQILAGQSVRQVADYRRLLAEIDEEVNTLQDHLEALEEVKLAQF